MCRLIFYLSIDTSVLQYWYLSILPNMQSVLQYCHPSASFSNNYGLSMFIFCRIWIKSSTRLSILFENKVIGILRCSTWARTFNFSRVLFDSPNIEVFTNWTGVTVSCLDQMMPKGWQKVSIVLSSLSIGCMSGPIAIPQYRYRNIAIFTQYWYRSIAVSWLQCCVIATPQNDAAHSNQHTIEIQGTLSSGSYIFVSHTQRNQPAYQCTWQATESAFRRGGYFGVSRISRV